jgi:hypothetical protein
MRPRQVDMQVIGNRVKMVNHLYKPLGTDSRNAANTPQRYFSRGQRFIRLQPLEGNMLWNQS